MDRKKIPQGQDNTVTGRVSKRDNGKPPTPSQRPYDGTPPLIAERHFSTITRLLPLCTTAVRLHHIIEDPRLLLALGYVLTGLDPLATSALGGVGLFLMSPALASDIARQRKRTHWDLADAIISVEFAAYYLSRLLLRFILPRPALAAWHQASGATDVSAQQFAQRVMDVWHWLREHFDEVLAHSPPEPTAGWRLVAPPYERQSVICIGEEHLPILQGVAERLGLIYWADAEAREVVMGVPAVTLVTALRPLCYIPQRPARLLCPLLGTTAHHAGFYHDDAPGIDLYAFPGTPVVAAAAGYVRQSYGGVVIVELDTPFRYGQRCYRWLIYSHLSRLRFQVTRGASAPYVLQGEWLGSSGRSHRVPLIHFAVTQEKSGAGGLRAIQLAACFGWLRGGGQR